MSVASDTDNDEPTRRDVIKIAHLLAGAGAAGGGAAVVWPLVSQMNPDASVLALSTKEVDLTSIPVGGAIKVFWQGKPVFIRRRSEAEIAEAEATAIGELPDKDARSENLAGAEATDVARVTDSLGVARPEWLLSLIHI